MDVYRWLVFAHIAAGSIALLTFWTAAIARKGSPLHRAVGKGYLLAMLAIMATALPMAAVILRAGVVWVAVFLVYLVVITATSCWLAWRAIRRKREQRAYFDGRFRAVAWLNLCAGLVVFAFGLAIRNPLLATFCWIGVAIGVGMLRQLRNPPTARNWWLQEHYGSMLGNGVATHVAFLGIGLRDVIASFDSAWIQLLPWFLPLGVAMVAGVYLDRKYAPRPQVTTA